MYSKAMFAKQFKELIDKSGLIGALQAENTDELSQNVSTRRRLPSHVMFPAIERRTSRPLWSWPLCWA